MHLTMDHLFFLQLLCPKCTSKLGSFSWWGEQCSCGHWVTPAFQIHKSRVDEARTLSVGNFHTAKTWTHSLFQWISKWPQRNPSYPQGLPGQSLRLPSLCKQRNYLSVWSIFAFSVSEIYIYIYAHLHIKQMHMYKDSKACPSKIW